jgi:hypothetical protein
MSYQAADRVLETTTTTGTGAITLAGAIGGYRAFSSVILANGDMFPYVIAGGAEWETGIGTRTGATTFTRVPTSSSNANALVSFSAGTKEVWIDYTAAHVTSLAANNLFVNSGMEVSQQIGTTAVSINQASTGNGTYLVDMMQLFVASGGTAVMSCQQVADAPPGFKYSIKATVTTADAAVAIGDYVIWRFNIEGYKAARLLFGSASANSFALGFWVKANRIGTYSGSVLNSAFNRSYPFNLTINVSATWEYKTIIIPGDVTGTWDTTTGAGLVMTIAMMCGTTNAGTANTWSAGLFYAATGTINGVAATTDFMNLTGISIIPGIVPITAEQSPLLVRPFDEAHIACQRYYEKSYDYAVLPGAVSASGYQGTRIGGMAVSTWNFQWDNRYKVRKRLAPTVTGYSPTTGASGQARDLANNTDAAITLLAGGETGFLARAQTTTNTANPEFGAHWVADARL